MTDSRHKLEALRARFSDLGVDGIIVPRSDEHLGENAPACAERLAWLTGFTGSAGLAIVLADRAIVFSDGRYVLQLAAETDPACYERGHVTENPPKDWLAAIGRDLRIGVDPRLMSEDEIARYTAPRITIVRLATNPIDALWHDRPAPPPDPARPHPDRFSGRPSAEKRAEMAAELVRAGEDAAVLTDPTSIAWLLNIRGSDLPTTPVALGFAILRADAGVDLFMQAAKLPPDLRAWLGNTVSVQPPEALEAALRAFAGRIVRVDRAASPAWFAQILREAGATVAEAPDPCIAAKACKNEVELDGMRDCHRQDAVAVARFLHWLAQQENAGQTEISATDRLRALRAEQPGYVSDSFDAISGAGEHGAVIHYRATPATDRAIAPRELYLIDSGGQYENGTTDVTRTVWTGGGPIPPEQADQFTRVLKGHIALAVARFPDRTPGHRLDALARSALWQAGLDYDHGTGHGVGSALSVHEGPISIASIPRPAPIRAGMVISNEPGFYRPGSHGIRIENLLAVRDAPTERPFLEFETLTLVPIDRACIDASLLDDAERDWLDRYHDRVLREIGPLVPDDTRAWLKEACAPI